MANFKSRRKKIVESMDLSRESRRATLNEFLRISAAESGRLVLQKQRVNLRVFLEEIEEAAPLLAQEKPVALHLNLDLNALPDVWLNRTHIRQSLNILLSIAIKYAEPNTAITLSVRRAMNLVVFSVMHRGGGILECVG